MATTTNYGWTTPNDTDLVKDGAAAIRTLGSSIDTTTKALNPSTTLGDIEYRSATANTNTRLGIGTNGQYLTVTGGVPAWGGISAGGMTLLSTTTLSGATTTVSSINQTYTSLIGFLHRLNVSGDDRVVIAPNNTNSTIWSGINAATTTSDSDIWYPSMGYIYQGANLNNSFAFVINNYASTTSWKPISWTGSLQSGSAIPRSMMGGGAFKSNSAVTSLVFTTESGATFSGGTLLLYGVK